MIKNLETVSNKDTSAPNKRSLAKLLVNQPQSGHGIKWYRNTDSTKYIVHNLKSVSTLADASKFLIFCAQFVPPARANFAAQT